MLRVEIFAPLLEVMELLGVDAAPGGMSPTAGEISVGDIIE
jgi:hypothetical protein